MQLLNSDRGKTFYVGIDPVTFHGKQRGFDDDGRFSEMYYFQSIENERTYAFSKEELRDSVKLECCQWTKELYESRLGEWKRAVVRKRKCEEVELTSRELYEIEIFLGFTQKDLETAKELLTC